MKKASIEQIGTLIAQELETNYKSTLRKHGYSVPDDLHLRVSLSRADGQKIRRNAGADAWAPESAERMQLWLEPSKKEKEEDAAFQAGRSPQATVPSVSNATHAGGSQGSTGAGIQVHTAEAELLRALDRAESTPGWSFVSLKKFRDEILPLENVPSIRSDVERQNVLRSAIDKRLILKKPVPNPKSPQFPVTSIRLNRLMPEVQEVLGQPKKDLDFHPIHIKGEPLSATILRERR
jgi:hypothetical protein